MSDKWPKDQLPMTTKFSVRVKDLISRLEKMNPDAHILTQLTATEESGAWMLWPRLSDELKHFKWDAPVHILTVWHPDLKHLPEFDE